MKLLISEEYIKELNTDVYCIKASMLKEQGPHLFIASNKWDELDVELCPSLPVEGVRFLCKACENIKVKCAGDYNEYMEHLLLLFPNKGGALRRCKVGGSDVSRVIGDVIYA